MPKVFISHSWEDNDISRQIAKNIRRDGAEIWIDYSRIIGGDKLPEKIGEALKWCDTLVLIWSKSASESDWVKEEWTNAFSLKKRIIPCILDNTELPAILSSRLYINLQNFETGYRNLFKALEQKIIPIQELKKIGAIKEKESYLRPFITIIEKENKFVVKNIGKSPALFVKIEDVPIVKGEDQYLYYTFDEIDIIQAGEEKNVRIYKKDASRKKEVDYSFDLGALLSRSAVSTHNLSISYKDMNNQEFQMKGKWGKGGIVISQSH